MPRPAAPFHSLTRRTFSCPSNHKSQVNVVPTYCTAMVLPQPVDRDVLTASLNEDLAGEYQAVLMYSNYAAKLTGPFRNELRALFQAEIADELGHAQFLADKIAALGGEPTTEARRVQAARHPREMLQHALAAEIQAIADYGEASARPKSSATSA